MGVNRTGIPGSGGAYMKGHTGYGRTRRPKALTNDSAITSKETAKSVAIVASGNLVAALTSPTAGLNGYSTENQRFLHLQIENDAAKNLTLYAYNYAFGAWSPLYVNITNGTSATAGQVIATYASIDGKKLLIVPIAGIDRIAFTSADAGNMVVRAACTSF